MSAKLQEIRLYGEAGKKFGRVHYAALDTNSPAEAIKYLRANFKGVDAYLVGAKDRGVGFAVFRGKENITKEQLGEPVGDSPIRIAPIILGSKNGGIFQIILGIALIAVAAIATGGVGAAFAAQGVWGAVAVAGLGMAIGGVVQMLTPMPKAPSNTDSPDNQPSAVFNGAVNTQAQGNPVPLLYGRMIVGSAVISAGINAEDYAPATAGVGPGFDSNTYDINDPVYGWNPKTPYDAPPMLR